MTPREDAEYRRRLALRDERRKYVKDQIGFTCYPGAGVRKRDRNTLHVKVADHAPPKGGPGR